MLKCDELVSSVAFNVNLRRYTEEPLDGISKVFFFLTIFFYAFAFVLTTSRAWLGDGSGPAPGDRDAMSRSVPPPGVEAGRSAIGMEADRSAAPPPASIVGTPAGDLWARVIR
jgi:hypothetical protein